MREEKSGVSYTEVAWSWIGAFLGVGAVAFLNYSGLTTSDTVYLIGSFGASAVLIYGAIASPLAQPRNLLGGHIFSAIIGVTCYRALSFNLWFASAFAVATAIAVMQLTKTVHPPGGATALIAVIGSDKIHQLGYMYVAVPVALGAVLMLIIAIAVNRVAGRKYPV